MNFDTVNEFEKSIAEFFGSKYAIAVDSCTHGVELCLLYLGARSITVPKKTYISIPFLAKKLGLDLIWEGKAWENSYELYPGVFDAAVLWKKDSYIPGTLMNISFQYQKHLSLGRGGIILTDNDARYDRLKRMSYDGRIPGTPWRDQDIEVYGLHYYMTPETAAMGLAKLPDAIETNPKIWNYLMYPDLTEMKIFKDK